MTRKKKVPEEETPHPMEVTTVVCPECSCLYVAPLSDEGQLCLSCKSGNGITKKWMKEAKKKKR